MEFTGGITASILDTFEQSVRTAMESELKDIVCQEMRAVAAKEVDAALANVSQVSLTTDPSGSRMYRGVERVPRNDETSIWNRDGCLLALEKTDGVNRLGMKS